MAPPAAAGCRISSFTSLGAASRKVSACYRAGTLPLVNASTDARSPVLETRQSAGQRLHLRDDAATSDDAILRRAWTRASRDRAAGAGDKFFCAGADIAMLERVTRRSSTTSACTPTRPLRLEHTPKLVIAAHQRPLRRRRARGRAGLRLRVARAAPGRSGCPRSRSASCRHRRHAAAARLLGKARALELMLRGPPCPVDDGKRIGLVSQSRADASGRARRWARSFCARPKRPRGRRRHQARRAERAPRSTRERPGARARVAAAAVHLPIAREGIGAYIEKRRPAFEASDMYKARKCPTAATSRRLAGDLHLPAALDRRISRRSRWLRLLARGQRSVLARARAGSCVTRRAHQRPVPNRVARAALEGPDNASCATCLRRTGLITRRGAGAPLGQAAETFASPPHHRWTRSRRAPASPEMPAQALDPGEALARRTRCLGSISTTRRAGVRPVPAATHRGEPPPWSRASATASRRRFLPDHQPREQSLSGTLTIPRWCRNRSATSRGPRSSPSSARTAAAWSWGEDVPQDENSLRTNTRATRAGDDTAAPLCGHRPPAGDSKPEQESPPRAPSSHAGKARSRSSWW
jgi:hypothetical protein